jgi:hypothetical protein
MSAALRARPKARLPVPSDQCVQRADTGQFDCVKKRNPRRGVADESDPIRSSTLDWDARLKKRTRPTAIPPIYQLGAGPCSSICACCGSRQLEPRAAAQYDQMDL